MTNTLYYGDNLDVLRRYIKDETVDLIYLDPPFNSNANYNVLFSEQDGSRAAAQIQAFQDTWQWDQSAAETFNEIIQQSGKVADTLRAFQIILGHSNMLAYLTMMAARLVELHRVFKPTGSIYLHCDPTASHYLKILLDVIFGGKSFKTELIWKRSSAHSDSKQGSKQHGRIHDVLFFYTKTEDWIWNDVYTPYDKEYLEQNYRNVDDRTGRFFKSTDLTAAKPGGDTSYEWKGKKPPEGRYWAYSKTNMEQFEKENRLFYTKNGIPRLKQFLDEMPGVQLQDIWVDIPPISSQAAERLGYPTQKPQALLERIIQASSNPGGLVLDPFCGCGTAIAAAQKLDRRWIGIDITHLAIGLIKRRLLDSFGAVLEYDVIGEPVSLSGAQALAQEDPYQFQWWALSLVNARPAEQKKGADQGIDGRLYFIDDPKGSPKQVIFSVKAGHTRVDHLRDLRGVLDREDAQIGVLICLQEPTKPMRTEAASSGFYRSPWGQHPRIQILTIEDLLAGKSIDMPAVRQTSVTYKKAPKQKKDQGTQLSFGDE